MNVSERKSHYLRMKQAVFGRAVHMPYSKQDNDRKTSAAKFFHLFFYFSPQNSFMFSEIDLVSGDGDLVY